MHQKEPDIPYSTSGHIQLSYCELPLHLTFSHDQAVTQLHNQRTVIKPVKADDFCNKLDDQQQSRYCGMQKGTSPDV